MGAGNNRLFIRQQRLLIPVHLMIIHISIQIVRSIVNQVCTVIADDPDVINVLSGILQGLKCIQKPLGNGLFIILAVVPEQIIPDIHASDHHIGQVVHVTDIGINIRIHLINQLQGIIGRIIQHRVRRVVKGQQQKHQQSGYD